MNKIKILIVDDQALILDALQTILSLEKDFEVAGTASNGKEAIHMSEDLAPDVILLDIRMPDLDGVEVIKVIKGKLKLKANIIMLTTFNDEEYIVNALAYGACGYLLKDMESETLIQAIYDVMKGQLIMPQTVASKLAGALLKIPKPQIEETVRKNSLLDSYQLTVREKEIAKMLYQGFNNRQIAMALNIMPGTVKNHLCNIYNKLSVLDRSQAIILLKDLGL